MSEVIVLESSERGSWRSGSADFDKGDLKDELKIAGFEDCVADSIADRVDDKSTDKWTQMQAREEALREIESLLDSSQRAYESFKQRVGPTRTVESTPL